MRLVAVLVASFALAAVQSACNECTLVGCTNPVGVSVVDAGGAAQSAFQGTFVDATGTAVSFTCPSSERTANVRCLEDGFELSNVFDADAPPATIEITLGAIGEEARPVTLTPTYSSREVNGPGCGVCHDGLASVTLP